MDHRAEIAAHFPESDFQAESTDWPLKAPKVFSYDTEHVRNVGNSPTMITGLPTLTELFTNTNLTDHYR